MTDRLKRMRADRTRRREERERAQLGGIDAVKVAMFAAAAAKAIFDAYFHSQGAVGLPVDPHDGPLHHRSDLKKLGLSEMPATLEGLTAAWREVARAHHPDRGGDAARFSAAKEAYDRLALTFK